MIIKGLIFIKKLKLRIMFLLQEKVQNQLDIKKANNVKRYYINTLMPHFNFKNKSSKKINTDKYCSEL